MNYILHIDTSGEKGIVAISFQDKIIAQKQISESKQQATTINYFIADVLSETKIDFASLSAVSVIGGPGSYTGLRIGLATAKGICYALNIPLIMHSKLELLALQNLEARSKDYSLWGAILPAREQEYFFAVYSEDKNVLVSPVHFLQSDLVEKIKSLTSSIAIFGVFSPSIIDELSMNEVIFKEESEIWIDFWAKKNWENFRANKFENLSASEPLYLKQAFTHK